MHVSSVVYQQFPKQWMLFQFFSEKMGPQLNLPEAIDLVSGWAKVQTQNRLTVKIANTYLVLSPLPGFDLY